MNPHSALIFFFGKGMFRHAVLLAVMSILSWYLTIEGIGWGGYLLWISLILLATIRPQILAPCNTRANQTIQICQLIINAPPLHTS